MRILLPASTLLVLLTTCGCRSFTSPAREHALANGITWMDYDATRRGALILPDSNSVHVLSEPAPDVALGVVADFTGKVSYQGVSGEAAAKVTESIAELGKRTQTVMVLREALFRLNEMQTYKNDLKAADIKELYSKVLETTLKIAQTDSDKAAGAKAQSVADLLKNVPDKEKSSVLHNLNLQ